MKSLKCFPIKFLSVSYNLIYLILKQGEQMHSMVQNLMDDMLVECDEF